MAASKFRAEALKSLAFGSIGAGYSAIGTSYAFPISKIYVVNNTDEILLFSFDGTTDHFPIPSNAFLLLDITIEDNLPDYLPIGDSLYVKQLGVPTSGSVYLTAFYGTNR